MGYDKLVSRRPEQSSIRMCEMLSPVPGVDVRLYEDSGRFYDHLVAFGLKTDRAAPEHTVFDCDFAVSEYNLAAFDTWKGGMVVFPVSRNHVCEDTVDLLRSQGMTSGTLASVLYALGEGRGV